MDRGWEVGRLSKQLICLVILWHIWVPLFLLDLPRGKGILVVEGVQAWIGRGCGCMSRLIGVPCAIERTHEMAKGFAALDPMLHVCGHVHGNLGEFGRYPTLDEWKFTSLQF